MAYGIAGKGDISNNFSSRKINSNSLVVGDGPQIKAIRTGTFFMFPNNAAAISTFAQQTQTISGLSVGDIVHLDIFGTPATYVAFERCYVSGTDTLTIIWRNLHHSSSATDNLAYADSGEKLIRYLWFDLT